MWCVVIELKWLHNICSILILFPFTGCSRKGEGRREDSKQHGGEAEEEEEAGERREAGRGE